MIADLQIENDGRSLDEEEKLSQRNAFYIATLAEIGEASKKTYITATTLCSIRKDNDACCNIDHCGILGIWILSHLF